MFENITKGVWMIDEDRVKVNKHGCTKYPIRVESVGLNETNVVISYEIEPNKQNAEFICFAFNLQQKYDIGLFEETINLLSILTKKFDYKNQSIYSFAMNDIDKAKSLLNKVKQNK